MSRVVLLCLLVASILYGQPYTRGVGDYPGDPNQDFAPTLVSDTTYRNLALHRPAYQSSAYDYNLTAQLVTDGIKETSLPRWISTSTSQQGTLKKNQRELLLDHNPLTTLDLRGTHAWVQFELAGGGSPLEVDHITVEAAVQSSAQQPGGWTCVTPAVGAGGTVSCSIASLAPLASGVFTLTVKVSPAVPTGTVIAPCPRSSRQVG